MWVYFVRFKTPNHKLVRNSSEITEGFPMNLGFDKMTNQSQDMHRICHIIGKFL